MITESLYRNYQDRLITTSGRADCKVIVKKLLTDGILIKDLYVNLFQRSLYEVGVLWETNKISVATEHFCTAITESMISLSYPYMFAGKYQGKKAIITCTPGEHHHIAGRMVADYFELNGWDGLYLGDNIPEDAIILFITENYPDLLAVSMSVSYSLNTLDTLIVKVRQHFPDLPIVLGGQGFNWEGKDSFIWGSNNVFKTMDKVCLVKSLDELDEKILKPMNNDF